MENTSQVTISVGELNRRAKMLLETQLNLIWVAGEISNFSQPSSGHWYFSLKDNNAQIRCAMFRNRNLATRFKPKAGMSVRVRGRVSLYEPRGDYQLLVDSMTPEGEGLLQQQFEKLKAKLSAEGLFDRSHKLPIPAFVTHIAIISSPSGAAVHDILTVLKRRNPSIEVTLIPSLVQGNDAPEQLIRSLSLVERMDTVDAIIIGRGGGSLEDMWCFNDEELARKIASMSIPIISAVGHEIDFCIADFVADQRAPTPSAAAELLSGDSQALLHQISSLSKRCLRAWQQHSHQLRLQLTQHAKQLKHPGEKLAHWQQRTDICELRLTHAMQVHIERQRTALDHAQSRIRSERPDKLIKHARSNIDLRLQHLKTAVKNHIENQKHRFELAASELNIVSPLSTLQRGYSIARDNQNKILKTAHAVKPNHEISVQLHDGKIEAKVFKTIFDNNPD